MLASRPHAADAIPGVPIEGVDVASHAAHPDAAAVHDAIAVERGRARGARVGQRWTFTPRVVTVGQDEHDLGREAEGRAEVAADEEEPRPI